MYTLTVSDPRYPVSFRQTSPVPSVLYAEGDLGLLQKSVPKVAIVGSRKMSAYGKQVTTHFARQLSERGVAIVSGLAYGVDAQAHRAMLSVAGKGIAILPSSLDMVYPSAHDSLAQQIRAAGGLLLTEYPAATPAAAWRFIARNRLIAALSQAVIVTEAAQKSGSLHTAQFALDQGIDVFAVPGSIFSSLSAGCHSLISAGAEPATCIDDIARVLDLAPPKTVTSYSRLSDSERAIIKALDGQGATVAELAHKTGLGIAALQQQLTLLELQNHVTVSNGAEWRLTSLS